MQETLLSDVISSRDWSLSVGSTRKLSSTLSESLADQAGFSSLSPSSSSPSLPLSLEVVTASGSLPSTPTKQCELLDEGNFEEEDRI